MKKSKRIAEALRAKSDPDEIVASYSAVFKSQSGAVVLDDLIQETCGELSFSSDPYATAYKEGRRSLVLNILAILENGDAPPVESNFK